MSALLPTGAAHAAAGQAYRWRPLLVALASAVLALALLAHGWNLLRLHTALDADAACAALRSGSTLYCA